VNYSKRFQEKTDVEHYESVVYDPNSPSAYIWELQKPFFRSILEKQRQQLGSVKLLDFACGTGRVLSFFENFVDISQGVDISPAMVEVAKTKCKKSTFHVGDICADPNLANEKYDVISCFRFILNAGPAASRNVLRQLRKRLDERHGLLLVNMHGNSRSLRHPGIVVRQMQRKRNPERFPENYLLEEMSPSATRLLLNETGFDVVQQLGYGLLPQMFYRRGARPLARWIDRTFAASPLTRNCSIDLAFVCRPKP
jgi:SAM-dependent methyltransferase